MKKSYNCFYDYKVNDLIDTSTINYIIGKNQVSTVRYISNNDITDKSKYNCLKRDFLLYTDTNGVEYYDKDL
ncbi:MAG: hypothetical protein MJ246_02075 [Clostridia bacterium]|nr:hypothetical protein [Clostridia bacterium]